MKLKIDKYKYAVLMSKIKYLFIKCVKPSLYKPIYTVTTFTEFAEDTLNGHGTIYIKGSRTPCYRHSLKWAKDVVETNMCDIWETIYTYAVIEEVPPILYPIGNIKRWWYKWDNEKQKYIPMEEPENYSQKLMTHVFG